MTDASTTMPSRLEKAGVLRLDGEITQPQVRSLIDAILERNLNGSPQELRLYVNAPGGDVDQGFALIDIMRWSRLPIATTALGFVGSMALLVFMAGTRGRRTVMPSCSLLSHRFSACTAGHHADLMAQRVQQDLIHRRILAHYRSCTGLVSDEQVEAELLRSTDRWLTPQEAVDLGIADRVWSPSLGQEG